MNIQSRIPADEYAAIPGVSITRLKELKRSAKHYRWRLENPLVTEPLTLGIAAHCAVLEPERFTSQFAIWSRRSEKSGNLCPRNGQYWDAFQADHLGKDVLTEDECSHALTIGKAVRSDPVAMRYLDTGDPEVTMQWEHKGVACRGRADWLTTIDGVPYLIGLKTARNCSPFVFGSAAAKLAYHLQWAFYRDGYTAITGIEPEMKEIVVESAPPHDVVVYTIPSDVIEQGREEYEDLMRLLAECEARKEWLGVANGQEQILSLPTWAYNAMDDIAELGLEAA